MLFFTCMLIIIKSNYPKLLKIKYFILTMQQKEKFLYKHFHWILFFIEFILEEYVSFILIKEDI